MWSTIHLCLFLLVLVSQKVVTYSYRTVFQQIQQEPEFSNFYDLIRNNARAKHNFNYEPLTVFVPENKAFDQYDEELFSDLASYHMTFEVKTLKLLRSTNALSSVNLHFPPLWITKINDEIYVNNAKILQDESNYVSRSRSGTMGHQQVLHVVDQVLDPMIRSPEFSPSAHYFMTSTHKWNLDPFKTVSKYFQRVQTNNLLDLFEEDKPHTFFIPVDSGMEPRTYELINKKVILHHVVPNHVLFTRPAERNVVASADEDSHFTLSFERIGGKLFVKGTNRVDDFEEYFSEILVSDIPVKNGVIHLIAKPMGNFNILRPFPFLPIIEKITNDPELDVVYKMGSMTKFNEKLERENVSFTYFVTNNYAWVSLSKLGLEPNEGPLEILSRHLVISHSAYSMKQLATMTLVNNNTDIELISEGGPLKFSVEYINGDYFIKWNKMYVKVIRPDYECTNGMVHILNAPLVHLRYRGSSDNPPKKVGTSLVGYWNILKQVIS